MNATVDRLKQLPGVVAAGATTGPLLDDSAVAGGTRLQIGDRSLLSSRSRSRTRPSTRSAPGRVAGRLLRSDDRNWSGIVINVAFARRFWPGLPLQSVPGQIVSVSNGRTQAVVVGIVPNVHDRGLDRRPSPAMYRLLETPSAFLPHHFRLLRLRDRGQRPDTAARQAVAAVDPNAVVVDTAWLDERLAETVRERSFATLMLVLLRRPARRRASGLAGAIAFVVARRTRGIAIRRAVGAEPSAHRPSRSPGSRGGGDRRSRGWLDRRRLALTLPDPALCSRVPPADLRTLAGVALLMIVVVLIAASGCRHDARSGCRRSRPCE